MHHDSLFTIARADASTFIFPDRFGASTTYVLLAQPGINPTHYTVYEWQGTDCIDITPAPDWLTLNHHLLN
jgi:hypothetical protein